MKLLEQLTLTVVKQSFIMRKIALSYLLLDYNFAYVFIKQGTPIFKMLNLLCKEQVGGEKTFLSNCTISRLLLHFWSHI